MAKTEQLKGGTSLIWLQGLACGALAAMAPAAAVNLGLLLAPGIIALILDRQAGRPVARAILLCQGAACVLPAMQLWSGVQPGGSLPLVPDPQSLGAAWAAAAVGWLLTQLIPIGIGAVMEATSVARAARLRAAREHLAEEWGLDPPADQ